MREMKSGSISQLRQNKCLAPTKKGRRDAGLHLIRSAAIERRCRGSVSRHCWGAEAVVDADRGHVDVLLDTVSARQQDARICGEDDVTAAHEQMVVFGRDRPARCKAELDA